MVDRTKISWTQGDDGRPGATWNPTDGCEVCSPGCKNCYAMRIAGRFSGPGKPYHGLVTIAKSGKNKGKAVWNGEGRLNTKALLKPLHWRAPRGVFVDSMSDLFFEAIKNEEIAASFGVAAAANQHRYMILTKRAKRMLAWYRWLDEQAEASQQRHPVDWDRRPLMCWEYTVDADPNITHSTWNADFYKRAHLVQWPLPYVWQGVSVDDRKHGVPRLDYLRQVNAAVRWASIEPLLEDLGELDLTGIDWIVIGCESGPGSRECKPEWVESIIEQAQAQNVDVWLKQLVLNGQIVKCGPGSDEKGRGFGGRVIERPYLRGRQHLEMP